MMSHQDSGTTRINQRFRTRAGRSAPAVLGIAAAAAGTLLVCAGPGARLFAQTANTTAAAGVDTRPAVGSALPGAPAMGSLGAGIATARQVIVGGQSAGEVDVNGRPVLRIRSSAGGFPPIQRAQIVANRINQLSQQGRLADFHVGYQNGETVVMSGSQNLITASSESARSNHVTPAALAHTWAANLRSALSRTGTFAGQRAMGTALPASRQTPAIHTYGATTRYTQSLDEEHTADKLVPILSVGTGVRLGGALVTGPSFRVAQVAAVAQLEGKWKNIAEARLLVPVSNPKVTSKLDRVPEVSVYAVADYRLP